MSLSKPYYRLWRPLKGYSPLSEEWYEDSPRLSIQYLKDGRFACQAEMESLVTTAHLIIRDLYEVFDYIEPNDANLSVFSHRLYELFLRAATEFETNCKGILKANGYNKNWDNMYITDYCKIASVAKLPKYKVAFKRWATSREFKPFSIWEKNSNGSLVWYQNYNHVKHNRYKNFSKANFDNVMNAISGLLCILHAQIGKNMSRVSFEGIEMPQTSQELVDTGTFTIIAPSFPEDEQYDFIWDNIKEEPKPVNKYNFK